LPEIVPPVALYRFYAEDHSLLYVGITESPAQRWRSHAADRPWWPQVADAKVEWHKTRADAAAAELAAIRAENPRYNLAGVGAPEVGLRHVNLSALEEIGRWAALSEAAEDAAWDIAAELEERVKRAVDAGCDVAEITAAHLGYSCSEYAIERLVKDRRKALAQAAKEERAAKRAAREAAKANAS
jgi:hypothetical protein